MIELKPCPFCGGNATFDGVYNSLYTCKLCIAEGPVEDGSDPIRWNTRPLEEKLQAENDALNKIIDGISSSILSNDLGTIDSKKMKENIKWFLSLPRKRKGFER